MLRAQPRSPEGCHGAAGSWEGERGDSFCQKCVLGLFHCPHRAGIHPPSAKNRVSASQTCHWIVQGEGSALTSGIQVQLTVPVTQGAAQVGRSAVMVTDNELPVLGGLWFPKPGPLDVIILKGTRDCHRGARNLHQEFPLGGHTSEKGSQGQNTNISAWFLVSYSLYIPLNTKIHLPSSSSSAKQKKKEC